MKTVLVFSAVAEQVAIEVTAHEDGSELDSGPGPYRLSPSHSRTLRIPKDADQRSELMSITIPK